ncbi:hypothetical protein OPV22_015323 [Ensete ventricosum]|uniref:Protein MIZU-KUSSEI 1 n=1 Tax=Ensete ventricosum TaxID=4639 RepID=A0AAV8RDD5_ENSVE|nr:hypothetical protein OPV22_015323 [Ensete ventricosum]
MKTINMGRTTIRDSSSSSSSSSRRHFQWRIRRSPKEGGGVTERKEWDEVEEKAHIGFFSSSYYTYKKYQSSATPTASVAAAAAAPKRGWASETTVSRLLSVLTAAASGRRNRSTGLGVYVTGTLYGYRRGHVHLAFQTDSKSCPVVLVELATPTSTLVREMASGLVRIALECDRKARSGGGGKAASTRLVEEPLWRSYINGNKCGYAVQRNCGPADWKVLRAVEPVSMGAGVIPGVGSGAGSTDRDVMYMRARFERVVGSKDSEAFYMMNPDGHGSTELSVYLLRV